MNLLGIFMEDPQNYNMGNKIKVKGKDNPVTGCRGP